MLVSEIKAWERRRNREKAKIKWMFTVDKARTASRHAALARAACEKLGKAYPVLAKPTVRRAAA